MLCAWGCAFLRHLLASIVSPPTASSCLRSMLSALTSLISCKGRDVLRIALGHCLRLRVPGLQTVEEPSNGSSGAKPLDMSGAGQPKAPVAPAFALGGASSGTASATASAADAKAESDRNAALLRRIEELEVRGDRARCTHTRCGLSPYFDSVFHKLLNSTGCSAHSVFGTSLD